ncbi:MAG TPA: M15 family metallopeptidase, partial [Cryobacterium sp.]|nr:M15 family metallopeptidase [Cryobacterium sp.]
MGRRTVLVACMVGVLMACAPADDVVGADGLTALGVGPVASDDAVSDYLPAVAGEGKRLPLPPGAPPAAPEPMFTWAISEITDDVAARMAASWRPGCPVPLEDLRLVTVDVIDFDGAVQTGELVVHADSAEAMVSVFSVLFAERFPIRQMRLVDEFGADDSASMAADNTSAFNCRAITGGTAWSEHAYGRAIDINPVENPYVRGAHVAHVRVLHRVDVDGPAVR